MFNARKATLICDLQFGSTGKGLIAGYLAERDQPDTVMAAWSANAGHTYIDSDNRKYVHCMLPNGIVSPKLRKVLLGPGSQLNLQTLMEEIGNNLDHLAEAKVYIHENACVIQDSHVAEESGTMTAIGSTKKGCGAAMIEKIRRNPNSNIVAKHFKEAIAIMAADVGAEGKVEVATNDEYLFQMVTSERIQVEGAQGYSLGINSGFYPYVTSRECTPAQICSDTLLPIRMVDKVVGTMRTYPIRVANRYDENGEMVGWSGPCYQDQKEVSFEALGQEVEHTTVTKLPRRIFTFSEEQTAQAMAAVMPDEIFLNFANYCKPGELVEIMETIRQASGALSCGDVKYLGRGPAVFDIQEM